MGDSTWRAQQVQTSQRGVFVPQELTQFRDILDGTSNTIALAEIATDLGDRAIKTLAANNPGGGGDILIPNSPQNCGSLIDPERPQFWLGTLNQNAGNGNLLPANTGRGFRWAYGAPLYTSAFMITPPNAALCNRRADDWGSGNYSASGRHPGGVHVVMADASVQFISESIDVGDQLAPQVTPDNNNAGFASPYGVWGALGTRAAKDIIESDAF